VDPSSRIAEIVQKVSGVGSVGPATRLFHDLHLAGDDVDEMLTDLHEAFGTDFSGLSFSEYFPPEHEALVATWAVKLGFQTSKRPVTLQHLCDVVERGAWFDPPS